MTEEAVSRQIGRLEDFPGVRLFARVKNRVHLVDDAKAYSEAISELLARIEQATLDLIGRPSSGVLELAVMPTFASKWTCQGFHTSTRNIRNHHTCSNAFKAIGHHNQ